MRNLAVISMLMPVLACQMKAGAPVSSDKSQIAVGAAFLGALAGFWGWIVAGGTTVTSAGGRDSRAAA